MRSYGVWSPSSRRAWIEIKMEILDVSRWQVALLAEGVDRNAQLHNPYTLQNLSPSSRRAWIEI